MWKSLFLPLAPEERVVFASHFDPRPRPTNILSLRKTDPQQSSEAALNVLCVLENQEIVIFGMDSAGRGPYERARIRPPHDMCRPAQQARGSRHGPGAAGSVARPADDAKAVCGTLFSFLIPVPDRPARNDVQNDPIGPLSDELSTDTFALPSRRGNIQSETPTAASLAGSIAASHQADATRVSPMREPFVEAGAADAVDMRRARSDGSEDTVIEVDVGRRQLRAKLPPHMAEMRRRADGFLQTLYTPTERNMEDRAGHPGKNDDEYDDDDNDAATDGSEEVTTLPRRLPLTAEGYEKWLKTRLYRGAVGSSNGRIDIFTGDRYVMGFQAHTCPVVAIRGIIDDSEPDTAAQVGSGAGVASVFAGIYDRLLRGDACRTRPNAAGSVVSDAAATTAWVTERIVFVTQGADGSIYVWRRSSKVDGYTRRVHFRASFMKSISCFDARDGLLVTPGPSYSAAVELVTARGDAAEKRVFLQGTLQTTRAIALDGHHCIVARGNVIYSIDYATKMVHRLLLTDADVTFLHLAMPYGVAGCANGRLVFFSAEDGVVLSGAGRTRKPPSRAAWRDPVARADAQAAEAAALTVGTYQSNFCTHGSSEVQSLSLHRQSMTSVIVDKDTGAVEVVQLPEEFLRCPSHNMPGRQLAQGAVLARLIALDEGATNPTAEASIVESLLLSRYLVPDDLRTYCGRQMRMI